MPRRARRRSIQQTNSSLPTSSLILIAAGFARLFQTCHSKLGFGRCREQANSPQNKHRVIRGLVVEVGVYSYQSVSNKNTMMRKFSLTSLRSVSTPRISSCNRGNIHPLISHNLFIMPKHVALLMIVKKPAPTAERTNVTDGLDSPPYSPTPSAMERPRLSSRLESQLRRACTIIVQETNPPDHDGDEWPDQNETLKRYIEESRALRDASQVHASELKIEPATFRHYRRNNRHSVTKPAPYTHIPKNAAASFEATAGHLPQRADFNADDEYPTSFESNQSSRLNNKRNSYCTSADQLASIRAAVHTRPKTSAAACIDYTGPSVNTSHSTSRTTTTCDDCGCPSSTGLSSVASPGDEKISPNRMVNPKAVWNNPHTTSSADSTAKDWMTHELARRRTEFRNGRTARPGSRVSALVKTSGTDRPTSRASILAESMKEGIRDYIRPRISSDSMRPTRSEYALSRSDGRGRRDSCGSGNRWWRGSGSERKSSWSSFPSSRPDEEEQWLGKDGFPNLNRELPALPGLNQYKEKKPTPHIAQLWRPGRVDHVTRSMGQPSDLRYGPVLPKYPSHGYFTNPEKQDWYHGGSKPATQRLRHDAMMASPTFEPFPREKWRQEKSHRDSDAAAASPLSVAVAEVTKGPSATGKKAGLRQRLMRFWSHGPDRKAMDAGGNGYGGVMVPAN